MHGLALAAVVLANTITGDFTRYPAFLPNGAHSGIEAITDRGLIAELIVRCSEGVAVLSYSKAERLFCTPKDGCFDTLIVARRTACSR